MGARSPRGLLNEEKEIKLSFCFLHWNECLVTDTTEMAISGESLSLCLARSLFWPASLFWHSCEVLHKGATLPPYKTGQAYSALTHGVEEFDDGGPCPSQVSEIP